MKIFSIFKMLKRFRPAKYFDYLTKISEASGKSRFFLFWDTVYCALRYGAGPLDYSLFEFYNKTAAQRKTYITRVVNNTLVKRYNDARYVDIFEDKYRFDRVFSDFIHRKILPTEGLTAEALRTFCEGEEKILYKPLKGTCGKGIESLSLSDYSIEELLTYLQQREEGLIEEVIVQHSDIARIYPHSVNTVRLVTLLTEDKVVPLFAFWRIGNGSHFVDNLNSDGIAAKLNAQTGMVEYLAADKTGKTFSHHPQTGAKIADYQIPHWDKVLELATAAAKVVPQVGYVGWDVAVLEDGVELIEGNSYPGHDILGLPAYTPDKIGLKPLIDPYLK